ncbi:MAG: hotdog family protein [Planctomycetota bacterium]
MRFQLVDRITELERGKRIVVSKVLSRAEEYLADHFPKRPVMPGVMMLQVCVEAAMWLLRDDGKAPCGAVLTEVRNIRYGNFFEPGGEMTAEVQFIGEEDGRFRFKAEGRAEGERVISARLVLEPLSVEVAGKKLDRLAAGIEKALDERFELISTGV